MPRPAVTRIASAMSDQPGAVGREERHHPPAQPRGFRGATPGTVVVLTPDPPPSRRGRVAGCASLLHPMDRCQLGDLGSGSVRRVRWSISIPQLDADGFDGPGLKAYPGTRRGARLRGRLDHGAGGRADAAARPAGAARLRRGVHRAAPSRGRVCSSASLHDPLQLAASITAVDRLSHGRLDVGVAPGGGFRKFAAFGVDPETFVAQFTEGLELMKAAWSDEPRVRFEGRFRQVDDLPVAPKPVQRPHPPIWFGASAPRALARAVRHGDAFLGAGSSRTTAFAEQVGTIRAELDRQGRDPAAFPIGKRVYLTVDDDPARARERVVAGLRRIYGGMPGIEHVPVSGTAQRRRARAAGGRRRGRGDDPAQPARRRRRRGPGADGAPRRRRPPPGRLDPCPRRRRSSSSTAPSPAPPTGTRSSAR